MKTIEETVCKHLSVNESMEIMEIMKIGFFAYFGYLTAGLVFIAGLGLTTATLSTILRKVEEYKFNRKMDKAKKWLESHPKMEEFVKTAKQAEEIVKKAGYNRNKDDFGWGGSNNSLSNMIRLRDKLLYDKLEDLKRDVNIAIEKATDLNDDEKRFLSKFIR